MGERIYHDTIVLGGRGNATMLGDLDEIARRTLAINYPHSTLLSVAWTFASTVEEVEAWTLPHDCDDCRDGKAKAISALRTGIASTVALGNMLCSEPGDG